MRPVVATPSAKRSIVPRISSRNADFLGKVETFDSFLTYLCATEPIAHFRIIMGNSSVNRDTISQDWWNFQFIPDIFIY